MCHYILRLDDASPKRNINNWNRMEKLLDQYKIKPIVGVIPNNQDPAFIRYDSDDNFWTRVDTWKSKRWTIAMHGFNHVYVTEQGGINPVQQRSEFAGLPLSEQRSKLASGVEIMREHGIDPLVFFAPSHTFDHNTLIALKEETNIQIISDTIASDIYFDKDFYFIPQQSGHVRRLPFPLVTFCYHPDQMTKEDFKKLSRFLKAHKDQFISFDEVQLKKRKLDYSDKIIRKIYLFRRWLRP